MLTPQLVVAYRPGILTVSLAVGQTAQVMLSALRLLWVTLAILVLDRILHSAQRSWQAADWTQRLVALFSWEIARTKLVGDVGSLTQTRFAQVLAASPVFRFVWKVMNIYPVKPDWLCEFSALAQLKPASSDFLAWGVWSLELAHAEFLRFNSNVISVGIGDTRFLSGVSCVVSAVMLATMRSLQDGKLSTNSVWA